MEPFRSRSNTWPLPRPDISEFADDVNCNGDGNDGLTVEMIDPSVMPQPLSHSGHDSSSSPLEQSMMGSGGPKKNTSRRNAWGNMSYADLITQAINGSPEKRLTLSQIYDWMVQNVPYFKDKGDSNSSAGWKNSIRHNLSLHNRFMRVQNEGTGKSSWWMINPDAKPGKAARRRATSMETSKYEKKRGRVKKKIEALKNGLSVEQTTPSPSSSVSEGLDMFPDSPLHHTFQLSPEFRPRASSNASSCGRLSPITAVENDMHDNQVPPLSPLAGWNNDLGRLYTNGTINEVDQYSTEQLVELANTMKLGLNNGFLEVNKTSPTGQLSPAGSHVQLNNQYNHLSSTMNSFGSLTGFNNNISTRTPNGSANGSDTYSYQSQPPSEVGAATLTALNNVNSPSRLLATVLSLNNPLPNDLDLDSVQGGLECDVDSVIRHELSVDGSLDFNFDSSTLHHSSNPVINSRFVFNF